MWYQKIADLLGADPYPGQDPETQWKMEEGQESPKRDYSVTPLEDKTETFNWAATPVFVLVGTEDVDGLLSRLGWSTNQPYAAGTLSVYYRWDAMWEMEEFNMSLQQVEKSLKAYTKDQGWHWQGLSSDGDMVSFKKKGDYPGIGEINPGVKDWRNKEWSGMETHDSPGHEMQEGYPGFGDYNMDQGKYPTPPEGLYECSECGFPSENMEDFRTHIMKEHVHQGQPTHDPQPVMDLDDALPAQLNRSTMDTTVMRQSNFVRAITSAGPKINIPGPIPFIYDIEGDRIYVGHPGERHSDIQGRFTPGGIIEGLYDPKGNVQIKTDTDMPYTVKHMGRLWYAMHPELEIKAIYLLVGQEKHKLASSNIGHKVKNLLYTDPAAEAAYKALSPFGTVYAVGGAVRDVVLGKTPNDIDLMVQGVSAKDVQDVLENLPGRVDYTGKQFGVFRYNDSHGNEVEVALPRKEQSTGEGHKDFDVQSDPFMSVEDDLQRRDFTANAMAVNLDTGELVDPYNGSQDIKNGELKTVSDKSFEEDPLRILRTLTAISRHGLIPTPDVLEQIEKNAHLLDYVSAERIQAELDKMIKGQDPAKAIELLERTGVFRHILPEYEKTLDFDQNSKYHHDLLHNHLKGVLRDTSRQTDDPDVRWAAWLHDIGKPRSQWTNPDTGLSHYYKGDQGQGDDHWEVGARMSDEALSRLRFPNDRRDRITHLVKHHMFPRFENEKGARKFVNRVGDQHADDLLTLRGADIHDRPTRADDVGQMRYHLNNVRMFNQPTGISSLAINGDDLIEAGFQPGPQMGKLLQYLGEQVIEDPELNNVDTLMQMAQESWDGSRQANILDPIQTTLDPAVFNHPESAQPEVKPKIIEWVKRKVFQTMVDAGWPDPANYMTMILTGSLTTYQWAAHSDFDVSLWIDVERFPEWVRADLISLMVEKCDGTIVPGTTHPVQCFVVDSVRYKPKDLYQPGLRSGYNFETGQWLVPPEPERSKDVTKMYPAEVTYAKDVVSKMKILLKYDKYAVKTYWRYLHRQRFLSMRAGKGDFSPENIIYKMLSNEDLFPLIEQTTGEHIA